MNKEFIPYDLAIQLKDLGFDEECMGYYNIDPYLKNPSFRLAIPFAHPWCLPAPLYQQVFRWFRDKYQLYAWVKVEYEYGEITPTYYITGKRQSDIAGGAFETYEEAELACLKKLIELVKSK